MPVMETKAADVFAFGMLAVEVFTGEVPFGDQRWNEAVALHISRGGRPKIPGNAHAVGLTVEMWELLESCWQQDPEERPTMGEVVSIWRKFVEKVDKLSVFSKCVQITPPSGSEISISGDRFREPLRVAGFAECNSQRQTMTGTLQPRTKAGIIQLGTVPAIVQRGSNPEAIQLGQVHGAAELGTEHNTQIPKQVPGRPEVALQRSEPVVPQPVASVRDSPPSESIIPRGFLFKILTCRCTARTRRKWICGLFWRS